MKNQNPILTMKQHLMYIITMLRELTKTTKSAGLCSYGGQKKEGEIQVLPMTMNSQRT